MFDSFIKYIFRAVKYFCAAFTTGALIIMFTPVSNQLANLLEIEPTYKKADVIIVLAGGAYQGGTLTTSSNERILQGINLFKMGYAPKLMIVGSSINSTTRKFTDAFAESSDDSRISTIDSMVMKDLAVRLGTDENDIIIEKTSTHTYENIKKAMFLMKENNLKTSLLVSSGTHMYRVARIAKKMGLNFMPAHAPNYTIYRVGAMDRLRLFDETIWEFMGLGIYWIKGWI
ncbi:MAG: YdcF family protein [Deltaproteobacteria bacterium]|nr:YdcF family protein [Deltaproteobacteria bacterium]